MKQEVHPRSYQKPFERWNMKENNRESTVKYDEKDIEESL